MRRICALALLLLAWGAAPAHAALTLCNRTSYVLYAATAALNGQKGEASGWTRITPGDCAARATFRVSCTRTSRPDGRGPRRARA